jgi:hypothetical protein
MSDIALFIQFKIFNGPKPTDVHSQIEEDYSKIYKITTLPLAEQKKWYQNNINFIQKYSSTKSCDN